MRSVSRPGRSRSLRASVVNPCSAAHSTSVRVSTSRSPATVSTASRSSANAADNGEPARAVQADGGNPAPGRRPCGSDVMHLAAHLAALIAALSIGVVYGTDAFCALVQRPALARVDDAKLTAVMGNVHRFGHRRMPAPASSVVPRTCCPGLGLSSGDWDSSVLGERRVSGPGWSMRFVRSGHDRCALNRWSARGGRCRRGPGFGVAHSGTTASRSRPLGATRVFRRAGAALSPPAPHGPL